MAYVYNPGLSEEENRKLQEEQAGAPIGGGGLISGGQPAGAVPGAPTSTGQQTNVQKYVEANRSQSEKLAGTVGDTLAAPGTEARQKLQAAVPVIQGQIESARVPLNQGLVDEAAADPTKVASDAAKKSEFQKLYGGNYGGPGGIEDLADFQAAEDLKAKHEQNQELLKTPGGRSEIMSSTMKPGTGRGLVRLNQMLLESTPEAQKIMEAKQSALSGLGDEFTAAQTDAASRAAAAKAEAEGTGAATRAKFQNEVIPGLEKKLTDNLSGLMKSRSDVNAAIDEVQAAYDAGTVPSAKVLESLGMTPDQFQRLTWLSKTGTGIGADKFKFTAGDKWESVPDLYTAAGAEDAARAKALEDLTGTSFGMLPTAERAKAGTYAPDTYGLGHFTRETDPSAVLPEGTGSSLGSEGLDPTTLLANIVAGQGGGMISQAEWDAAMAADAGRVPNAGTANDPVMSGPVDPNTMDPALRQFLEEMRYNANNPYSWDRSTTWQPPNYV